jgi:branched-chain amino acid transport system permease protein
VTKQIVQILYSAMIFGSIYALMSIGLSLVWGGLRVLNLTQGALFMLGAYTAMLVGKSVGLHPVFGVIVAFLAMGVLGLIIYFGAVRLLVNRPDQTNATLLVTIGLAIILENIALLTFGPRNQAVPELVQGAFKVGGVVVTWNSFVMTVTAIAMVELLAAALKWTRLGMAVRALAQNREAAQLSAIDPDRTFMLVMFVSSGLAGVGGVLLSSYYFVSPYIGQTYLLTALIVTILGGLGSLGGTLAAAYVVGVIQSVVSFYLGVRWAYPVFFTLVIIMLVFRPSGLAGKGVGERL